METMEELNFRSSSSKKSAIPLLALFFLCWHPAFIGSESLTLTTYYPAPYGGYVSLLTTGNTLLARDGGVNTRVGVGIAAPASKLDVSGGGNATVDFRVNGRMQTGDANGNGGIWLNSANDAFVGNVGGNVGFWTSGVGWNAFQIVKNTGRVGIGTNSPDRLLQVAGDIHINGDLYVDGRIMNVCTRVGYGVGGVTPCPAGRNVVGFMGDGVARVTGFLPGGSTTSSWGTFIVLGEDWGGTMVCCKF